MKSFLALALVAASGIDPRTLREPLIVLATADEESTMAGARALAQGAAIGARRAIVGEPTSLRPIRGHKGLFMEAIRVTGRSGHSSDPSLGRSALEGMHRVIGALLEARAELAVRYRDDAFAVPHPTLNLGRIRGGDSANRICGECELLIDARFLPAMRLDDVRESLRARARAALVGTGLEIAFEPRFDGIEGLATEAAADLVRVTEELTGAPAGVVAFGTEAPLYRAMGMEVVVLGPGSIDVAHQPDEYLPLSAIDPAIALLQRLVAHYCTA
jgi:acetylornithine deacetylase